MKTSKIIFLSFLLTLNLFNTSCKKEIEEISTPGQTQESEVVRSVITSFRNVASESQNNPSGENEQAEIDQAENAINSYFCFDFVYPVSIIYNDGTTQSLTNDNEFADAIINQTENHFIIDFAYPFEVIQDGNTIIINNEEDFENLINSCVTITPVTPSQTFCFEFVYPVSVEMNDGTSVTVNNDEEMDDLFINSTDQYYPVDMVYPFEVVQDEETIIINNTVEFNALLDSCFGNISGGMLLPAEAFNNCFSLNYPVDLILEDGSTVTVNNNTEYNNYIFAMNPPYVTDFVYDISITHFDGSTQVIHNINEFAEAINECYMNENPLPDGFHFSELPPSFFYQCVELVYPVTIVFNDGSTQVANNEAEYNNILGSSTADVYVVNFQYPINIIFEEQNYTINNLSEIMEYIVNCDMFSLSYTESVCFEFVYPVTVIEELSNNSYVANNDEELNNIMNNLFPYGNPFPVLDNVTFEFPVNVIFEGTQITLNSIDDYYDLINSCGL